MEKCNCNPKKEVYYLKMSFALLQIGKLNEMVEVGENPEDLKDLGILLDAESFAEEEESVSSKKRATSDSDDRTYLHR